MHITFDKQLRVTTDRRIVSAILDFRCSLSRRDNIRGAHDDLDIDSGSAADVRHGFGSRPLLVCVKTRAEQEPELGIFVADDARIEDFERALRCIPKFMWPIFLWEMRWPGWLARDRLNEGLWLTSN